MSTTLSMIAYVSIQVR